MKKKLNAGIVLAAVMLFAAASPSFSVVDFEKEILPVFQEKCFRFHSDRIKEPEGGVRLDSAAWIEKGGDYGSIVEKMQPEKSVVYKRMTLPEDKRGIMPPTGKGDPATTALN